MILGSVPDLETLASGLSAVLQANGHSGRPVRVLERRLNTYTSTFPSEIVRCGCPDGRELWLFCKYTAGRSHVSFGHRGDVQYEAQVYAHILSRLPLTTPFFFGSYAGKLSWGTWLIVEYLEDAVGADEAPSPPTALAAAAAWIGRFHAIAESLLAESTMAFLRRYDAAYYAQWASRTSLLAGHWHNRLPWLAELCRRVEAFTAAFLEAPTTVIHGEFTPHNVLVRSTTAYPIDWESAAVAFGEIDLVSLSDKWPEEVQRRCEEAYRRARWPGHAPPDFERRVDLGRLYWDLRWLGDRPEWTTLEKVGPRFDHLRAVAGRLKLIE